MSLIYKYIVNILTALDQLVNTILGGDVDETISSRVGKSYPKLAKVINVIFFWDRNHCQKRIETDEGKDSIIK